MNYDNWKTTPPDSQQEPEADMPDLCPYCEAADREPHGPHCPMVDYRWRENVPDERQKQIRAGQKMLKREQAAIKAGVRDAEEREAMNADPVLIAEFLEQWASKQAHGRSKWMAKRGAVLLRQMASRRNAA